MTKFQEGDPVTTKFGAGTVTYITPAEKLGTRPQSYHVEIPKVGTYDFDEGDLTAVTPAPQPDHA